MRAATKPIAMIAFEEARLLCGVGYSKMRELIAGKEFTVSRDGIGRGFRVKIRRDECEVYGGHNDQFPEGGLPALRKFRVKKGRS